MSPEQQQGRESKDSQSTTEAQNSVRQEGGVEQAFSLDEHQLTSVQGERLDLLSAREQFAEGDIFARRQAFSFLVSDNSVVHEEKIEVLLSAFEGEDPELQAEAFSQMQRMYFTGYDNAIVSRLANNLYQGDEPDVRTQLLIEKMSSYRDLPEDFPDLKKPSDEAIVQAFSQDDRGMRQEAIHFATQIQDEQVRESLFISAIGDTDAFIVERAYSYLNNRELTRTPEHESMLVKAYEEDGPGAERAVYLLHAMDPLSEAGKEIVLNRYFQVNDPDTFEQRLLHYPKDLSRYPEIHERAKPVLEAVHRDGNKSFPEKQAALEGLAEIGNPGILACGKMVLGSVFSEGIWKSRMKEAIRAMPQDSLKRQVINVASATLGVAVSTVKIPFQLFGNALRFTGRVLESLPTSPPMDNETRGRLRTASMSVTLGPLGLGLGLMLEEQERKAGKY